MKIAAIIQARMSSSRLPGKVMRTCRNRPLLDYLVERLHRSDEIDSIALVTSSDPSDAPIAEYGRKEGIRTLRGSLDNVASRYEALLRDMDVEGFVRVCADSPWMDVALVDDVARYFKNHQHDVVTNRHPRTYPRGESVEILSKKTFCNAFPRMTEKEDLEHVTRYFYARPSEFSIHNLTNPDGDLSQINLCVDSAEDFDRFCGIVNAVDRDWAVPGWREITQLYQANEKAVRA